jgi:predicted dehydrogenase
MGERQLRAFRQATHWEPAVCDPRSDRRDRMQQVHGVQEVYRDCADVDLERFQAVVVCTPPHLHLQIATLAVAAGRHVLLERPLSTSLAGVDTLLRAVEAQGVVLQVGHAFRSHPALRLVREWVSQGEVGEVLAVSMRAGAYIPEERPDYRDTYRVSAQTGGGCLLGAADQFDLLRWLVGEPEQIGCFASHVGAWDVDRSVEDVAVAMLRFPSGVVGDLHVSHVQRSPAHTVELTCRDGSILWSDATNEVSIYRAVHRQWERHGFEMDGDGLLREQAHSFAQAVMGQAEPRVTGRDGERALRLALVALQAARTSAIVRPSDGG